MHITWTQLKNFVDSRKALLQWEENDSMYCVKAIDGTHEVQTCVLKTTPKSAAQTDFEDNYKSNGNKSLTNDEGQPIMAPTFEDDLGLTAAWQGHLYSATKDTLNIYDELVTTQLKLRGGWYELIHPPGTPQAELGDYLEFSIVDKDDVLGLFSTYGLTVGVDVLELGKFVRKDYLNPHTMERQVFKVAGAFDVLPGLYFRTYFRSFGTTNDVDFKVVIHYHEDS